MSKRVKWHLAIVATLIVTVGLAASLALAGDGK